MTKAFSNTRLRSALSTALAPLRGRAPKDERSRKRQVRFTGPPQLSLRIPDRGFPAFPSTCAQPFSSYEKHGCSLSARHVSVGLTFYRVHRWSCTRLVRRPPTPRYWRSTYMRAAAVSRRDAAMPLHAALSKYESTVCQVRHTSLGVLSHHLSTTTGTPRSRFTTNVYCQSCAHGTRRISNRKRTHSRQPCSASLTSMVPLNATST